MCSPYILIEVIMDYALRIMDFFVLAKNIHKYKMSIINKNKKLKYKIYDTYR